MNDQTYNCLTVKHYVVYKKIVSLEKTTEESQCVCYVVRTERKTFTIRGNLKFGFSQRLWF